jgi:Flp pilus assembly protein TadB
MLSVEMANEAADRAPESTPDPGSARAPSDLIGVRLTLYLGVAIIAILAAFFLVGVIAGIIVLLAAVVLAVLAVIAVIRRADESG